MFKLLPITDGVFQGSPHSGIFVDAWAGTCPVFY